MYRVVSMGRNINTGRTSKRIHGTFKNRENAEVRYAQMMNMGIGKIGMEEKVGRNWVEVC